MCFEINNIALYTLFGSLLFLLNSISWEYFHGATYWNITVHFLSIVYTGYLFVYSFTDGHLLIFYILPFIKNATTQILAKFPATYACIFMELFLCNELLSKCYVQF